MSASQIQLHHPAARGYFFDVFQDAHTSEAWRPYDKMLYLVWWSYRPASCVNCGMTDAWIPSGDVEFKCAVCLTGVGTTSTNSVVENDGEQRGGMDDLDDSNDDDGEELMNGDGDMAMGNSNNNDSAPVSGGGSHGGPIAAYTFFYGLLQRIPVVETIINAGAATQGHLSQGGSGAPPPGSRQSSSMLPTGEALPMVLRAAYDMSNLLLLPGSPRGTAHLIRASSLYLSLLLHRFVCLFPLFCMALSPTLAAPTASPPSATTVPIATAEAEIQWVDIELLSAVLGVITPSFFVSSDASLQHLQNIFTVTAAYGTPSLLWHPGRVPGRLEVLKQLKSSLVSHCPVHSTLVVPGLSPEHTAMVVALELARRVDVQPMAASSTSTAAAAQNAQRMGTWLDALGLYPTRCCYRDGSSLAAMATGSPSPPPPLADVLTSMAASDDPYLLAAVEQHARRPRQCKKCTVRTATAAGDSAIFGKASAPCSCHGRTSESSEASCYHLVTLASPFHDNFEWLLDAPCANALLHIFARVFAMAPADLADIALRSGIYQGSSRPFLDVLCASMRRGAYDMLPLARRLSPLSTPWLSVYMALHSGDRLPVLAALYQLSSNKNAVREQQVAIARLLQKVLRKHQSSQLYQLNYVVRMTSESDQHFNGLYFLSSVLWQEGLAVFTCLRSGRKTITLNRHSGRISLCYMNAKERLVSAVDLHPASPVVAAIESAAVPLVMDAVWSSAVSGIGQRERGDSWEAVVRGLDKGSRVRRRMRVPMLASRLDALSSIRDAAMEANRSAAAAAVFAAGGGGGNSSHGFLGSGMTLLGWGETESLLAAPQAVDVRRLRAELQMSLWSLPHVSLLLGLSENRVVALYASLTALLELLQHHLQTLQYTSGAARHAIAGPPLNNWVEELLFSDEAARPGHQQQQQPSTWRHERSPQRSSGANISPRLPYRTSPPMPSSRLGTPKMSSSGNNSSGGGGAAGVVAATSSSLPSPLPLIPRHHYTASPPQRLATTPIWRRGEGGQLPPKLELTTTTAEMARKNRRQVRRHASKNYSRDADNDDSRSDDGDDGKGDDGDGDAVENDEEETPKGGKLQDRHASVMQWISQLLPSYHEVLSGAVTTLADSPAAEVDRRKMIARSRQNTNENEDDEDSGSEEQKMSGVPRGGGVLPTTAAAASSSSFYRHGQRQPHRGGAPPQRATQQPRNSPRSCRGAPRSAVATTALSYRMSFAAFNLFDADECRRRLQRMFLFIKDYGVKKGQLLERAAAELLPNRRHPRGDVQLSPSARPPDPRRAVEPTAAPSASPSVSPPLRGRQKSDGVARRKKMAGEEVKEELVVKKEDEEESRRQGGGDAEATAVDGSRSNGFSLPLPTIAAAARQKGKRRRPSSSSRDSSASGGDDDDKNDEGGERALKRSSRETKSRRMRQQAEAGQKRSEESGGVGAAAACVIERHSSSSSSSDKEDDDEEEEEGRDNDASEAQSRRKTKKSGRRRRRLVYKDSRPEKESRG